MRKVIMILILALFIISPVFKVLASNDTNYRFTGQEYEPMIDMYNFNQRDYTPNTAKFIQPDPVLKNLHDPQTLKQKTGQNLEQILSDPQNLNEYSYTKNNPVVYTDPEGETGVPIDYVVDPMFVTESYENMQTKYTTWSEISFGADAALLLIPFVPAVMHKTGDAFEGILKSADKLASAIGNKLKGTIKKLANLSNKIFSKNNKLIHWGRQDKHIVGTNNYESGRSIMTQKNPQSLVDNYSGKGISNYNNGVLQKETVDFGEEIGLYFDRSTSKYTKTTRGTIHYSKDGTHIVPARPNDY